jgi:putative sterol carrier protein
MTPKSIFEEQLAIHIEKNANDLGDVNATYQFNISGDEGGEWFISILPDIKEVKPGTHAEPDCVISMSDKNFVNLVSGSLNPQLAFMTGKLKVKGDFGLALKLGKILKT